MTNYNYTSSTGFTITYEDPKAFTNDEMIGLYRVYSLLIYGKQLSNVERSLLEDTKASYIAKLILNRSEITSKDDCFDIVNNLQQALSLIGKYQITDNINFLRQITSNLQQDEKNRIEKDVNKHE